MTLPADIAPAAPTETTATPDTAPAAEGNTSERDAMIAAVEGLPDDAAPEGEASKPKPSDPAKPVDAPAEPEPTSKIALAIRAREQAQKTRDQGKADAEQLLADTKAQAQKEAAQILSDARKTAEREAAEWRSRFKASPLKALNEQGIDHKVLVDEVSREGSAEWQAQKRLEKELEEVRAENKGFKAWQEEQQKAIDAHAQRQVQEARQQTEKQFVSLIPEGAALRTLYDEREILDKAHALADEYREKTGDVAPLEDLRDYLEEQASKRLASIRTEPPSGNNVSAAKPKANGPRTPSASSASERRTSPKPVYDMSPSEEYEAMKQAAAAAVSSYAQK